MKKLTLIAASLCLASSAFAGGYRVSLQGQKATGMGHTGVAMTESSEVVFFNPAGMSFLASDTDISGGVTLIDSEAKYQNAATNTAAKTDNPLGTPSTFYFVKKYNETISYGLGLYTPYGNVVEWERDWAGSHLVNDIELKAIFVQPTFAYKVNDSFSVGLGPVYVIGLVEFNRNLSTSLVDENGDRANVTVKGSGIDAWGYNIGFLYRVSDQLSAGINYRSRIDMEARGESADFENIPSSMQSQFYDTTFDADLVLPAELTIGLAYQVSPETTVALDINRTFWSEYESLDVKFDNAAGTSFNPRNYKDANTYRVGVQHKMDEKLTVRGGIYIDKSPIRDGYFTPETPRNDSTGYTLGASYQLTEKVGMDFSFLNLRFKEFEGSYDHYNQSGTIISFGGEYKSSVTAVGFGLDYKF